MPAFSLTHTAQLPLLPAQFDAFEVATIKPAVVVIDHGRLVHDGLLKGMLDTDNRTEIRAKGCPATWKRKLAARGATIERTESGIRTRRDRSRAYLFSVNIG
jgi:hypothetical protein